MMGTKMAGLDPRRKILRSLIEKEALVGLLNDTKWREILESIVPRHPKVRVKLLTEDEASEWTGLSKVPPSYIEPVSVGPVLCMEIEWIELRFASEADLVEVVRCLRRLGVNCLSDAGVISIRAYQRSLTS